MNRELLDHLLKAHLSMPPSQRYHTYVVMNTNRGMSAFLDSGFINKWLVMK